MFAITLAATLAASPDGPAFRFNLRGMPSSTVAVKANAPRGWLPAFCSTRICAIGHIRVTIPQSGVATLDLHMHNVANGVHGTSEVSADGESVAVPI
jgi:hypothetical protein